MNKTTGEEMIRLWEENSSKKIFVDISIEEFQELVGKNTPMKLLKSKIDGYRECGNCGSIVVSTNYVLPNYCSSCGQKIDWSDEE